MQEKNKKKIEKNEAKKSGLMAPKKLKILVSIIDRRKVDFYISSLQGHGVNVQEIVYAQGTTPRKISDLIGIKVSEKAILLSIVREDQIKPILADYEDKYFLTKNGKGIAFTVPMKSTIGVMLYEFLSGIERD